MLNNGDRFYKLTVVTRIEDSVSEKGRHRSRYLCKCDWGKEKIVFGENLTGGKTKSCGCFQKEQASKANTTHGDTDSRLYNVWSAMKRRCFNSEVPEYHLYGGRGITMCDDWRDNYGSFRNWAYANGYDANAKRGDCTIDRIDVNGNYEPSNCRWVSQKAQMNNVSYNHLIEYNGEKHTVAEWADIYNMPYARLSQRITKYGYSFEEAISKPIKH